MIAPALCTPLVMLKGRIAIVTSTMISSPMLRKLRPFVGICQIFGLVPFSMEMDPKTGGFLKFTFSFKKWVSWWYILLANLQVANFVFMISANIGRSKATLNGGESEFPIAVTLLLLATKLLYLVQVLMTKIVALRYKRLRRVISLIQEVERHFSETIMPRSIIDKDTILWRTVIGIFVIIFMTCWSIMAAWKIMGIITGFSHDGIVGILIALSQCFLLVTVALGVLMLHLTYYIVARNIELLKTSMKLHLHSISGPIKNIEIEKIKKNRYIFGCLCRATIQLNNIFSFPTLIAISSKLITSVYALFSILSQLRKPNPILAQITNFNYAGLLVDVLVIIIYFSAADMPIRQARLLREQIIVSSHNAKVYEDDTVELKIEVMCFLMQIEEDRIRLSGSGLFQAGTHLVPTLVATIITYLVILLQTTQ